MVSPPPRQEVTRALVDWTGGDQCAADRLMPLVYDELRALARHYLRTERRDHTLQATGLVHEAYLRLVDHSSMTWRNRAHFFAVAAQVMRRLLVDYARKRHAEKRGGIREKLEFDELLAAPAERSVDLIALHDALEELSAFDERKSRIIELRFFGGLSTEEIADVLAISASTVTREWRVARAWLGRRIIKDLPHGAVA